MVRLRQILVIINLKALVITALAVLSTWFCIRWDVRADFPFTLVATAVIFPVVFSISGAYKRRETALEKYADMKAHGRAIFLAARDWLPEEDTRTLEIAREHLGEIFRRCRTLFSQPRSAMEDNEKHVYRAFSSLSRFVRDDMRGRGLASGEVSRCYQYVSKMMIAFESTKHIYQYRTPQSLRAFSDIFIAVLPPLYGPYFAHLATEASSSTLNYAMPILFSLVLVALDNIQEHLEDPFDMVGEDDVVINVEKFVANLDP